VGKKDPEEVLDVRESGRKKGSDVGWLPKAFLTIPRSAVLEHYIAEKNGGTLLVREEEYIWDHKPF